MRDHLCAECAEHYSEVKQLLSRVGVPFVEDGRLVRGLDYYTRTAFEYVATDLASAQNAVGGGGRYDGLAETIGGRRAPGVGFALGVDRMILASSVEAQPQVDVFLVSETTPGDALASASVLRENGLRVDFDTEGRSVKSQFRSASRAGARAVVVVKGGDAEPVDVRIGEERRHMPVLEAAEWLRGRL
jgi:histidyl-tRNA synthetase